MPSLPSKLLGTLFYLGYVPVFPGTLASFVAASIVLLLKPLPGLFYLLTGITLLVGFLVAGNTEKAVGRKDPPCVVIDEAAGMFVSLLGLPPTLYIVVCAFVLFRIFDIVKPFPLKDIQKLNGSAGIMGDDLMAGVYTNIILQVVLRMASQTVS
jgi:phosphatidylglycerophosphatase A